MFLDDFTKMTSKLRLNLVSLILGGLFFTVVNSTLTSAGQTSISDTLGDKGNAWTPKEITNQQRENMLNTNNVDPNQSFYRGNDNTWNRSTSFTNANQNVGNLIVQSNENQNVGTTANNNPQQNGLEKETLPHYHDIIKEVPFNTMGNWQKYIAAAFKLYVHQVLKNKGDVKEIMDEIEEIIDIKADIEDNELKEALIDFFKAAFFTFPNIPDTSGFMEFNQDVLRLADENDQVNNPSKVNFINIISEKIKLPEGQDHINVFCKPTSSVTVESDTVIPNTMIKNFMDFNEIFLDELEKPLHAVKKGYYCQDEYNDMPRFKTFQLLKITINFYKEDTQEQYPETFVYFQTYHSQRRTILNDLPRLKIWLKDG